MSVLAEGRRPCGAHDLDLAEARQALLGRVGTGTSDRGAGLTVCPRRPKARRRAGRAPGNPQDRPAVGRLVTPADRAALLADLAAYSTPSIVGAQAILDDVELGARVAESFASASTA